MNSSKEMQKEIRLPEELERLKKEEGEIKDEKTEAVTGGYYIPYDPETGSIGGSAPRQTPIA